MPAFPERESSILAVLKKKKPGRVPENEIRESKSPVVGGTNHAVDHNNTPQVGIANSSQADLLGLSTPPAASSNTGTLIDVLGDLYSGSGVQVNNATQPAINGYNPKK